MVVALQASYQVGGRTKSCFFETDSWFRVPLDGNGWGRRFLKAAPAAMTDQIT